MRPLREATGAVPPGCRISASTARTLSHHSQVPEIARSSLSLPQVQTSRGHFDFSSSPLFIFKLARCHRLSLWKQGAQALLPRAQSSGPSSCKAPGRTALPVRQGTKQGTAAPRPSAAGATCVASPCGVGSKRETGTPVKGRVGEKAKGTSEKSNPPVLHRPPGQLVLQEERAVAHRLWVASTQLDGLCLCPDGFQMHSKYFQTPSLPFSAYSKEGEPQSLRTPRTSQAHRCLATHVPFPLSPMGSSKCLMHNTQPPQLEPPGICKHKKATALPRETNESQP